MYKRVLLAYDGSVEGRTALRLSVVADSNALLLAAAAQVGAYVPIEDDFTEVLNAGIARLKQLGFDPVAKLVRGEPAEEIGNFAKQVGADLIVVGHRRQSAFRPLVVGSQG